MKKKEKERIWERISGNLIKKERGNKKKKQKPKK